IAYTSAGSGDSAAVFTAELPQAGSWKLELHLPSLKEVAPLLTFGQTQRRGTWQLSIESTGLPTEVIHFDAADKAEGWAIVGEYQLPAGKIRLVFSDKTDGNIVIADAIRWSPGNSLTSDR
ncbi:MAG: hypothetical protein P8Y45_24885, partial [Exilibacterium sp.]